VIIDHDAPHHSLLFGDSSIWYAESTDLLTWKDTGRVVLHTRKGYFDSALVEAGPPPVKLSDGNYFFLYNSARKANMKNPKPDWHLEYNIGWAVLNGTDPSQVIARSDKPILSPKY
jgi:predicted GH43/DUF377 family glycosyl hydrolase